MSSGRSSYAVLGAGSWGTALAILLARNGCETRLWGRDPAAVAEMAATGQNGRYLPGCAFPSGLQVLADLAKAVGGASHVLLAVPASGFDDTLKQLSPLLSAEQGVCWSSKGLQPNTGRFLHELIQDHFRDRPAAIISGPSFAKEVACDLPTAVTVASASEDYAQRIAKDLHNARFRAYTSSDVIGVEVGGCVKNVYAIAAGIADGLGFGANARAALITRALAEMVRLGTALGGRLETFMGLTGVGDLILTCTDDQSRNRRLGLALGRGVSLAQALTDIGQAVEGARTAKELQHIICAHAIDMPLCEAVYRVLYDNLSPMQAVQSLLARDLKPEFTGFAG